MAHITVSTTPYEQLKVLEAIQRINKADKEKQPNDFMSVPTTLAQISKEAGIGQTKVRYIILDLIEANRLNAIVLKAWSKHYIRYRYEVVDNKEVANE